MNVVEINCGHVGHSQKKNKLKSFFKLHDVLSKLIILY